MTKQNYIQLIFAFAGAMQASWSLIIPLAALRFGMPLARKLQEETGVSMQPVIARYRENVNFWGVADVVALLVLLCLIPVQYSLAYALGCALTLFYGFFTCRTNPKNIQNFCAMVQKDCPEEDRKTVFEALRSKYPKGVPEDPDDKPDDKPDAEKPQA